MGELEVTTDPAVWEGWLRDMPHDVRHTPGFVAVACLVDPGVPGCARFRSAGATLVYPFVRRPLPDGLSDLTSPYDFGAFLGSPSPPRPEILASFLAAWSGWCAEQEIVSEFLRLDPMRPWALPGAETALGFERHQPHAVIALGGGYEDALAAYSATCRRNLRKAKAAGVVVRELAGDEASSSFPELYATSMDRVGAPRYYRFSSAYLRELVIRFPEIHALGAFAADRLVAAALFLEGAGGLYYFLGASDPAAWGLRPNNALFDAAARWAAERSLSWVHLGGGRPELARFKRGFAGKEVPFSLLRRIHRPDLYARLVAASPAAGRAAHPAHFPLYRAAEFYG